MAWIEDLSPLGYFGRSGAEWLRAVGWLERGQPYNTGDVSAAFFDRLTELARDPFQPAVIPGMHTCDLCQFGCTVGSANLFIPGDGVLLVCPELIVHYIAAHWYRPLDVFIEAVKSCPPMKAREYRLQYLANGGREWMRARKAEGL